MTAEARDAAIAAIERAQVRCDGWRRAPKGPEFHLSGHLAMEMAQKIMADETARLRAAPVERDELKDALLWHWAALSRIVRARPWNASTSQDRLEHCDCNDMRAAAAARIAELLEESDG